MARPPRTKAAAPPETEAAEQPRPARRRSAAAKPEAVAPTDAPPAKPRRAAAKPAAGTAPAAPRPRKAAAKPAAEAAPAPKRTAPATARQREIAAGPAAAPRRPRKAKASPGRLEELVAAARESLESDKAEDIQVLDVTDRASFTDRMIIATGLADRQIQAMAQHLEDALQKVGLKLNRNAIQASPDWVLIDCGDLVVHLFKPEARAMYGLERMWGPDSPTGEGGAGPA